MAPALGRETFRSIVVSIELWRNFRLRAGLSMAP
jgi:hypothetical protein